MNTVLLAASPGSIFKSFTPLTDLMESAIELIALISQVEKLGTDSIIRLFILFIICDGRSAAYGEFNTILKILKYE